MRTKLTLAVLLLIIYGCGHFGTVRNDLSDEGFINANLPIRELRVHLVLDGSVEEKDALGLIEEASYLFSQQAGVIYTVVLTSHIEWKSRDRSEMVTQLLAVSKPYLDEFDICIAVIDYTTGEKIMRNTLGSWLAVVDDTYRRYIVVKEHSPMILNHEIGHCFILEHVHSGTGLMASTFIELLPFVRSCINCSNWLADADREKILENKWRDFSLKVDVPDAEDVIREETAGEHDT